MKPSEFHGMLMDRFCIKNTNQKCHNSKNVCYDNNCSTSRSKSLFVSGERKELMEIIDHSYHIILNNRD